MTSAAARPVASEEDRKRAVRDLAADVVLSLYRAIKVAQMHALDNEAVRRQLLATTEAIRAYSLTTGRHVGVLFARGAVFFGGQPLRATRATYEAAIELGEMLARCGGAELGVSGNLTPDELRSFVVAVVTVLRDPSARFGDFALRNVRLRQVSAAALLRGIDVEDLDEEARIVRTYASAVVVLRRFYEGLAKGQLALPRRIKRIAQSLVDLSEGDTPAFLGVTHVQNAHDAAGRAVNSAILAVAMGRQLTGDRAILTRIALAAMMLDAGRPRALRHQLGEDDAPMAASLTEDAERSLPAGTAAVLTTLARASEAAMARTVVTYEALWLPRAARLGPVYGARCPASLEARIVATARAYTDLVTLVPGEPPMSPAAALIELDTRAQARGEGVERTMLRLVMSALGVLPPGTLIALTSGEVAVVVDEAMRLRIVLDASGGVPMVPVELEMGSDPDRSLARIVGTDPTFSLRGSAITPVPSVVRDGPSTPPPMRAVQPSRPPTTPPPQSVERLLASLSTRAPAISSPQISAVHDDEDVQIGVPTRMVTPVPPRARDSEPPDDRTEIMRVPPEHRDAQQVAPPSSKGPAEPAPPSSKQPPPSSARRPPDARGTMVRAPLPQLLVHLLARRLSGSLVLRSPSGDEHVVSVADGAPQRLRTTLGVAALGSLLTRRGYLTDEQVEQAVMRATIEGDLLGRQLVHEGLATVELIEQALREQISERLGALAKLPRDTLYAFFGGDDRLADDPGEPTPTDALAVIMATVRALDDDAWMDGVLAGLQDAPVKLHFAAEPERFCFTEEESEIVESLRAGWLPYADLLGEYAGREAMVRRVVYGLAITRHVDIDAKGTWPAGVMARVEVEPTDDGERMSAPPLPPRAAAAAPVVRVPVAPVAAIAVEPVSAPSAPLIERTSTPPAEPPPRSDPAPRSAPAPRSDPAHEARRQAITTRAAALDSLDHYALLGVAEDASRGEVEQAYLVAVKEFHPDRIPEALADLRDVASRIFVRLTDARATLLDAGKRAKYDAARAGGGKGDDDAEQAEVARIIGASTSFQKAEILLKRGDNAGAEKLASEAVQGDPSSSDHLALYGWLRAMNPGPGPLAEGLALLDRAIAANPESDRALCYRGALLKRASRNEEAIRDFRRAAEINPKNLDAVREVRLHAMRASGKGASKASSPLFGGLFDKLKKK